MPSVQVFLLVLFDSSEVFTLKAHWANTTSTGTSERYGARRSAYLWSASVLVEGMWNILTAPDLNPQAKIGSVGWQETLCGTSPVDRKSNSCVENYSNIITIIPHIQRAQYVYYLYGVLPRDLSGSFILPKNEPLLQSKSIWNSI